MDRITTVIVAAVNTLGKGVIEDGYNALKNALKKNFGKKVTL
ncbi:MAG: hypothetical protein ACYTX0_59085 [Nostoc sp.]